jgi:hypothetical protein
MANFSHFKILKKDASYIQLAGDFYFFSPQWGKFAINKNTDYIMSAVCTEGELSEGILAASAYDRKEAQTADEVAEITIAGNISI